MLPIKLVTYEEAIQIAIDLGYVVDLDDYNQRDDFLSNDNIIKATGQIYNWLNPKALELIECKGNADYDTLLKQVCVIFCYSLHYDSYEESKSTRPTRRSAYNILQANGLVGFNSL